MKLTSIELHNFRPYFGAVRLSFAKDEQSGLILVHGHNGYGKTSLHTAIQWALYGESGSKELHEHFNYQALKQKGAQMNVGLSFSHQGAEYRVVREARPVEFPVIKPSDVARSTVSIYRNGAQLSQGDVEAIRERIESIIPKDASQFFFFDGEQIAQYTASDRTKHAKDAIALVLGLRVARVAIDDAQEILVSVKRERNKAIAQNQAHSKLVSTQDELARQIEALSSEEHATQKRIADRKEQRRAAAVELDGLQEVEGLSKERQRLETELSVVDKARAEVVEALQKEARGLYVRMLGAKVSGAHTTAMSDLEKARDHAASSRVEQAVGQFIDQVLTTGRCICGRSVGPAESDAIRALVQPAKASAQGSQLTPEELNALAAQVHDLAKARQKCEYASQRFDELRARYADLNRQKSGLESRIAALSSQIRGVDDESVTTLHRLIDEADKEIQLSLRELGSIEARLEEATKASADLERQIAKVALASVTARAFDAQVRLLEKLIAALEQYYVQSALARKDQVAQKANHFFRQLTNKPDSYSEMFIKDDFGFGVKAKDGTMPDMNQVSAGEKQVVAFSFILGLNAYAHAEAPLMIDTPMGRLDVPHRQNLAKALAGLDQQVFLFVTDTDLGFGVDELLRGAVRREVEIVQDDSTLTSRIRELGGGNE